MNNNLSFCYILLSVVAVGMNVREQVDLSRVGHDSAFDKGSGF